MSTSTATLTPAQQTIVDAFEAGARMTTQDVAAELGKKVQQVTSPLAALVKKGVLIAQPGAGDEDGQTVFSLPAGPTAEVTPETVESTVVLTETLETALAAARERIEAGRETEVVTSKAGDYVKSARAGSAWITTDGQFICAKGTLEGTDKEPWALYRVGETLTFVGTFKTSSTPFLVATQAPFRA